MVVAYHFALFFFFYKILFLVITRFNCNTFTVEMQEETIDFIIKLVRNLLQSCLRPVSSSEIV